jgi:hypothetical protein
MKTKYFISLFFVVIASMLFTACEDTDKEETTVTANVEISVITPSQKEFKVDEGTFTFKNVNTGIESTYPYASTSTTLEIPIGFYSITFAGTATYLIEEEHAVPYTVTVQVQGAKEGTEILNTGNNNIDLTLYIVKEPDSDDADFVIAEIYATGSYLPETTKQYNGDQYIVIHNNNKTKTLYADGLAILESKFLTVTKNDYDPDIMSEAMAVQGIMLIPGDGTTYPVEPGKSIIICDNAIDHREGNGNSFDLSHADFEWYTESTSSSVVDVDAPEVVNLNIVIAPTQTIWILTKQGNKTYALGRLGTDKITYLTDYTYEYTYTMPNGNKSSTQKAYKIPNEWIIDAVNIGPKNTFTWGLVDPSLDLGFTYYGDNAAIAENIGKAIIRKVASETDGRVFYQDTDNSTNDFIPNTTATLLLNKE